MAHPAASAGLSVPLPNLFSVLTELFGGSADTPSLTQQAIEISKLSDAELADRDLKRGDIARFVMHDSYWS